MRFLSKDLYGHRISLFYGNKKTFIDFIPPWRTKFMKVFLRHLAESKNLPLRLNNGPAIGSTDDELAIAARRISDKVKHLFFGELTLFQ